MLSQSESPIYFKIPTDLKEEFDFVCKRTKTTKTKELYDFIVGYIEDIRSKNPQILERPTKWSVTKVNKDDPSKKDLFKGFWWE